MTPPDPEFEALRTSARAAVDAVRAGDMTAANDLVNAVYRDAGSTGVVNCMIVWCDMLLRALNPSHRPGQPVIMGWVADGKGEGTLDPTGLRPSVLWVTALVEARAADDRAAFVAICNNTAEAGAGITELLTMLAVTLDNREHLAAQTERVSFGPSPAATPDPADPALPRLDPSAPHMRVAFAALSAARDDDWDSATRLLIRLGRFGVEACNDAMMAWCDMLLEHVTGGGRDRLTVTPLVIDSDTRRMDRAVPDNARWAAEVIAARFAFDQDRYLAAVQTLPNDDRDLGPYIGAVLHMVSTTMRISPRGRGVFRLGSAN